MSLGTAIAEGNDPPLPPGRSCDKFVTIMKTGRSVEAVLLIALLPMLPLLFFSCSDDIVLSLTIPRESEGFIIDTLESSITGDEYAVYIALPEAYEAASAEPYPVVILTDGDDYFKVVWKRLARSMAAGTLRPLVLVGVGYGWEENRRGQDLTPTADTAWDSSAFSADSGLESGHADDFIAFITDDLLPFVEERYHIGSGREDRCLAGHSLGGLFSLFALTRVPDVFSSFVASSPALYWDSHVIFTLLSAWAGDTAAEHDVSVFASIGDQELFPNGLYLEAFMDNMNAIESVEASWVVYEYAMHGSVWEWAIPDGITTVLGAGE